jgi:hypothetical protein
MTRGLFFIVHSFLRFVQSLLEFVQSFYFYLFGEDDGDICTPNIQTVWHGSLARRGINENRMKRRRKNNKAKRRNRNVLVRETRVFKFLRT